MRSGLLKFVSFKGRAARIEFTVLILGAVTIWACTLAVALLLPPMAGNFLFMGPLIVLPYVIVLSAGVRRLHDLNWSGRFLVLGLNPITGPFLLIWLALQPGVIGANRYDLPSKTGSVYP